MVGRYGQMDLLIKAIGSMIKLKEKESMFIMMEICMKDNF